MSSPFQQKMMGKNPIKQLRTVQRMTAAAKAADEDFYKDIDPYEAEGNRMESNETLPIDDVKSYEYDYDQNPETGGPNYEKIEEFDFPGADGYEAKENSPLNAYVSTAGHFQRLQDNIARAFTPTKASKTKAEKEAEFKGETEKVEEKLKETTDKEFKGFKDGEYQIPSISDFQKNQADENYFNRFGQ